MNAEEAEKLASGRDYSDYMVDQIIEGIRHQCRKGERYYQYWGGGATAFNPESGESAARKLREMGYEVAVGHQLLSVSWARPLRSG